MKIKAATVREPGKLAVEELNLGEPGIGEVLVKLVASGVCHTDASVMNLQAPTEFPIVLGHEGVGIVEKIGEGVTTLKPGDHVIMSFPSCGHCANCSDGHPYACDQSVPLFFFGVYGDGSKRITDNDGKAIGSLFGQGAFADHCIVAERTAVKVDPELDLKPLCSLGCGVQTGAGAVLLRMQPKPGDTIAIFGCGAVGISAIMAAKLAGCGTIIAIDVVPSRLDLAVECGATHVINGRECEDVTAEIRRITNGRGVKFALEAAGVAALITTMLESMENNGLAIMVSMAGGSVNMDVTRLFVGPCVTFAGLVEGGANPRTFIPKLVEYYKKGQLPVDKLCTYYSFDDIDKAFEDSHNGTAIKPVVVF